MESPMMATSPLFSATLTISHSHQTYIGPPSEYFPSSDTTNKSAFLSLLLPTSTMHYSTAAQPEPHHAPHMFHVIGQSYCAHTSSRGHGFRLPQGLVRIWVSIIWHLLSSEFGRRCRVRSRARCWLQLVGCAALLLDASNFGVPDGVGESGVEPRISLRRQERVKEK